MTTLQSNFLFIFALGCLLISLKGSYETWKKKNAFGSTPYLYLLSIFVWGDAMVIGIFWAGAALVSIILSDWILFWLIASLFILVRSIGETIYWFNQQFSTITRMDPKKYWTNKIFHNDSVWFVFQIMNQCLTVVTIITSLYLARLWLASLPAV